MLSFDLALELVASTNLLSPKGKSRFVKLQLLKKCLRLEKTVFPLMLPPSLRVEVSAVGRYVRVVLDT